MSANASLTIVGGPQRIEPGRETTLQAEIVNLGTIPDDYRLSVREIDPAWVTFRPPTVFLQPGAQATASIILNPPLGVPIRALRPIFRLLSRRAGNVAIIEIALPLLPTDNVRPTTPAPATVQATAVSPPPARTIRPEPTATDQLTGSTRPSAPALDVGVADQIQQEPEPAGDLDESPAAIASEPLPPERIPLATSRRPTPTLSPPLLYGIVGGLVLLTLVAVGLLYLARQNSLASNSTAPTSTTGQFALSVSPVAVATLAPTITPRTIAATSTPAPPRIFVVANTGGDGVYLRRTTDLADRDTAYVDGTRLTQIGPDTQANGVTWRHVQTPDGKQGYIPAEYTAPAP